MFARKITAQNCFFQRENKKKEKKCEQNLNIKLKPCGL